VHFSKILIKNEAEHFVMGEVYVPLSADTDDDFLLKEDVRKMAWNFLAKGRHLQIDTGHDLIPNGCVVVESFIARKGDPEFKEGSWVMGVQVTDPDIWNAVQKGELNGFSFWSQDYNVVTIDNVPIRQITKLEGQTELTKTEIYAEHDHDLAMSFDDDGRVIPTFTGERLNHRHKVSKTTATDLSDHAHRLVY